MSDVNNWMATGRLTRDPDLRYSPKGVPICDFSLAVGRVWFDDGGNKCEEVCFVEIVAFGKTAENIGQYFKKGSFMICECRLKMDQWEDKQTGKPRSKLKAVLNRFTFSPMPKDENEQRSSPPARKPRSPARAPADEGYQEDPDEDDNVPF